jgi:hypothetical protein
MGRPVVPDGHVETGEDQYSDEYRDPFNINPKAPTRTAGLDYLLNGESQMII